ncbi:hypothetical protein SASPL_145422 [Salvia splendens]|uniref:Protein CMSS1 n=1 Tax=Salvia splendens TaxID=180675 RepID=A0A8X8Z848_SALSN|nr:protein CMSS1 [Salvia splendens]KAG6394832.1 hypothetical protein SASPL_145422 [Salvia splendens]
MGSGTTGAAKKHQKRRPQLQPKKSIAKNKTKDKKKKSSKGNSKRNQKKNGSESETPFVKVERVIVERPTISQQLTFLIHHYQSANGQLSSLELDSLKETCIVEQGQDAPGNLVGDLKVAFGSSWKEVLCEKHLQEGKVEPGSPALLVISSSALRSLELLREFRSLTGDCHAAKLFSKHMKIEEQVSALKNRVNIASGTPSRIKKLIDMEALGLSRLAVIVLDMNTDVKGYSLFTLPQVREEFWNLYKSYFHQPLLEGRIRLCLYGPMILNLGEKKRKQRKGA